MRKLAKLGNPLALALMFWISELKPSLIALVIQFKPSLRLIGEMTSGSEEFLGSARPRLGTLGLQDRTALRFNSASGAHLIRLTHGRMTSTHSLQTRVASAPKITDCIS